MELVFLLLIAFIAPSCLTEMVRIPLKRSTVETRQLLPYLVGVTDNGTVHTYEFGVLKFYYTDEKAIAIGNPPQYFKFAISGQHYEVFVYSPKCDGCGAHKRYNPSLSSTSKTSKLWVEMTGGTGAVLGNVTYDDIMIQDKILKNQSFLSLYAVRSGFYPNTPYDGDIGIMLQNTLYKAMEKQKDFDRSVISMSFTEDGGELIFGGSDPKYSGEVTYFPCYEPKKTKMWLLVFDKMTVNGNPIGKPCYVTMYPGIRDTEIPPLLMPTLAKQIGAVKHGDTWKVPCDKVDTLPPIVFTGQGKNFTIHAKDYVRKLKDNAKYCPVKIQDRYPYKGPGCYILAGDQFLTSFYIELDYTNQRIGIAPAK